MNRITDASGSVLHRGYAGRGGKAYWAQVNRERKGVEDDLVLRRACENVTRRLTKLGITEPPRVRVFKHGKQALYVLRIRNWMITSNSWPGLVKKAAWGPWQSFNRSTLIRKRWHENQA